MNNKYQYFNNRNSTPPELDFPPLYLRNSTPHEWFSEIFNAFLRYNSKFRPSLFEILPLRIFLFEIPPLIIRNSAPLYFEIPPPIKSKFHPSYLSTNKDIISFKSDRYIFIFQVLKIVFKIIFKIK